MTYATSWSAALAVGVGGALGSCARWGLGVLLNPLLPAIPLGTLAANLIGGYLVGVAVGVFHLHSSLDPLLKLFVITGVLGGLTTFSTFSAETVERLISGRAGYALALCALHLAGSLVMTWLGLLSVGARRVFMT
ncbi:MAG: fluoride efflux transporter CrcB [Zoogloeaceae bacterium]|jgi:CrcB protein|nr:fluoride efflux transporter CrcB [Zoogloeaceae bacterium]